MRIRLLNDGGFHAACKNVEFPVEVNADLRDMMYYVPETELRRIGADMDLFCDQTDPWWPFLREEVEVLSL